MKAILALIIAVAAGATASAAAPLRPPLLVPAGTQLTVSLPEPLISNVAKTGDTFTFMAESDVMAGAVIVVKKGATGTGTVLFAGGAGGHGHEGNLHVRFDSVDSTLGAPLTINAEVEFNGHKQKTLGLLSGGTWITGFGQAVRGGQAVVAPGQPIVLDLASGACIATAGTAACVSPAPIATSNIH